MKITRIVLEDYRNYGRLDMTVGPSVNILYGNNAQGKTNLIDAVCYGTGLESCRNSGDKEMVMFGKDGYKIGIFAEDDDHSPVSTKVEYSLQSDKKDLYVDNIKVARASEFINICNTVIFTPEDLKIVKSMPVNRRRFINSLITKVSPTYLNHLYTIQRLSGQKNNFLKKLKFDQFYKGTGEMELNMLDYSIADTSADIILARYRFILLLSQYAQADHRLISDSKEDLKITYNTITGCIDLLKAFLVENDNLTVYMSYGLSEGDYAKIKAILSDYILGKIQNARKTDKEHGYSSVGTHKDDLTILINDMPAKDYASQGQQRSAALSLKAAELEIVKQFVSSTPILLLDDVFSELDSRRRQRIVELMKGAQIFITCTDKESSGKLFDSNVTYFHVENGNIAEDN
ncbi:MAG: DNA replication/repair protein RecF [Clostridiales bacterium]|nr:DNA replication/repair protein RecF [Clostridiales bacterium]